RVMQLRARYRRCSSSGWLSPRISAGPPPPGPPCRSFFPAFLCRPPLPPFAPGGRGGLRNPAPPSPPLCLVGGLGLLPPAGSIFLVLWADGRMPWQFALPAGIGDVATASVAVVMAALLARNAIGADRATYAWCLFGIADIVVATIMGTMTSPGRAHLLALE